jgi:flagellar export protein FliJ
MEKQAWLQQRKQLKSYEVLQEREKARLALRQRRQEQKALDEFAARPKPE